MNIINNALVQPLSDLTITYNSKATNDLKQITKYVKIITMYTLTCILKKQKINCFLKSSFDFFFTRHHVTLENWKKKSTVTNADNYADTINWTCPDVRKTKSVKKASVDVTFTVFYWNKLSSTIDIPI